MVSIYGADFWRACRGYQKDKVNQTQLIIRATEDRQA